MIFSQPSKKLGELLVERQLITRGQLEQALLRQRTTGEFLGAILVREGHVKPETLLAALSEQFGVPHEALNPDRIDWDIVKQFPKASLAEGKWFPIRSDAETVTVAITNPLDAGALSAAERVSGFRRVRAVLVLPSDLQAVFARYRQRLLQSIGTQLSHGDQTQ